MITATARDPNGKQVIVLGITLDNCVRLIRGEPILVDAAHHAGFPEDLSFAIFLGDDEASIGRMLAGIAMAVVAREPPQ